VPFSIGRPPWRDFSESGRAIARILEPGHPNLLDVELGEKSAKALTFCIIMHPAGVVVSIASAIE
jgi:hypothetical protein